MSLIKKIDFGRDLEQMLNLYAEFRASFGSFPQIIIFLIYKALHLTFQARKLSRNKMTPKVVAFMQACVAYSYITVPMIQNIL
jgi:hypothetical protein